MAGTALAATDVTGVVPQQYWNVNTNQSGTASSLKDSNNSTTSASITWTAPSKWTTGNAGSPPFSTLMSSTIKAKAGTPTTVTITSTYSEV